MGFIFLWHFWKLVLTPKGRTGPTGAKPVLGSVVSTHTIFRIIEYFFPPNASRNKFCISANFMILGATDQKLWMFEVLRRGLVRAGMCWNQ
jgi:hypothetical protein